jgi:hypothetical protein
MKPAPLSKKHRRNLIQTTSKLAWLHHRGLGLMYKVEPAHPRAENCTVPTPGWHSLAFSHPMCLFLIRFINNAFSLYLNNALSSSEPSQRLKGFRTLSLVLGFVDMSMTLQLSFDSLTVSISASLHLEIFR